MATPAAATLTEVLREELALGRELEALLEREQHELMAGNADGLPELAARKSDATHRLSLKSRTRRQLVEEDGLGSGRAGLERACAAHGAAAQQAMHELLACARQIRALNADNEALTSRRLQQVRQSLSILLQGGGASPLTYAADGMTRAGHTSRARSLA